MRGVNIWELEAIIPTCGWGEPDKNPHNLGEGRLPNALDNGIHHWLGEASASQGDDARSRSDYPRATLGASEPTSATYYNDQPPEMFFIKASRTPGRVTRARRSRSLSD